LIRAGLPVHLEGRTRADATPDSLESRPGARPRQSPGAHPWRSTVLRRFCDCWPMQA
jgi:hypothetical protein